MLFKPSQLLGHFFFQVTVSKYARETSSIGFFSVSAGLVDDTGPDVLLFERSFAIKWKKHHKTTLSWSYYIPRGIQKGHA